VNNSNVSFIDTSKVMGTSIVLGSSLNYAHEPLAAVEP